MDTPATPLRDEMISILRTYVQKREHLDDGKYPKGHTFLSDLGVGAYCSEDNLEKEVSNEFAYFQLHAFDFKVNINGTIEANWKGIDNVKSLNVGRLLSAIKGCLEQGKNIEALYKREDFLSSFDIREVATEKIVKEFLENPINQTYKTKADILDKMLFSRETVFRDQQ